MPQRINDQIAALDERRKVLEAQSVVLEGQLEILKVDRDVLESVESARRLLGWESTPE
jgi:hypothetical protein